MSERIYEIKDRLREAMDLAEKRSADLTRDLNIPSSAMSQYLNGKSKNMPIDRLYKIAKYLNVSEDWLLGFDVPMNRQAKEQEYKNFVEGAYSKYLSEFTEKDFRAMGIITQLTDEELDELISFMEYLISKRKPS